MLTSFELSNGKTLDNLSSNTHHVCLMQHQYHATGLFQRYY